MKRKPIDVKKIGTKKKQKHKQVAKTGNEWERKTITQNRWLYLYDRITSTETYHPNLWIRAMAWLFHQSHLMDEPIISWPNANSEEAAVKSAITDDFSHHRLQNAIQPSDTISISRYYIGFMIKKGDATNTRAEVKSSSFRRNHRHHHHLNDSDQAKHD